MLWSVPVGTRFLLIARAAEGHKAKRMWRAEAVHARLYQMVLDAAKQGKDLPQDKDYLVPIFGAKGAIPVRGGVRAIGD
jgi:hypothetical protein